jgi:8-oxo-dGTP pyrophosphatase MutT (NUDIX family)
MTPPDIESLLQSRNLMPLIVEKLGKLPVDFSDRISFIRKNSLSEDAVSAAGVLLLLNLREQPEPSKGKFSEPAFILIKRSSKVAQPGDLSFPGGMLNKTLDPILKTLVTSKLNPMITGKARDYLQQRDAATLKTIALFFATALRETWEETNLSPFKISFLGPLPTYTLRLFKRTIFPLVGFVRKGWTFHPNDEVERIVEIPLKTFFCEDNYGGLLLQSSEEFALDRNYSCEFPCLVCRDHQDHEDILWGATFNIIMNFLRVVFDFKMPEPDSKRILYKPLYQNYLQHR